MAVLICRTTCWERGAPRVGPLVLCQLPGPHFHPSASYHSCHFLRLLAARALLFLSHVHCSPKPFLPIVYSSSPCRSARYDTESTCPGPGEFHIPSPPLFLHVRSKVHLFDIDIPGKITFKESLTLSPGPGPTVVDTEAGRLGIGICYDIRFPELAQLYAARGCQVLIYPGK